MSHVFKNPSVPPRFSQEIPATAAQLSGEGNGAVVQGKHLPDFSCEQEHQIHWEVHIPTLSRMHLPSRWDCS